MTREDARDIYETHQLAPGGICARDGKPYPCDELVEALDVLTGQKQAT